MVDRPTVLGVATYADEDSAVADFSAVWEIGHDQPGPVAAAVLVKGIDGKLRVDRDDTTAPGLSWCGALIGGALAVVAAPLAVAPLSVVASQDGSWAGIGVVVEYFWHHIPKSQLLQMSDLIESGQAAVVIVAVDHRGSDIEGLLRNASETIVTETDGGDLEQAYHEALAADQPLS